MPSTLVHFAVAGLIAGTLLHDEFDVRSLGAVLAVTAIPDLDAFLSPVFEGAHRAALHTLLVPVALAALFVYDLRRDRSLVRRRFGDRGVAVGWVSLVALVFAGILPDVAHTGANLLYPLHDRFYTLEGHLLISDQRGVVQTFVDLSPEPPGGGSSEPAETTNNTHHPSAVDPAPDDEPEDVERKLWIVGSGERLLLMATSACVVSARLVEGRLRR
ncbi:metal-dependent hydrolase [Halobaculum sp. CBA1158]|uniref:metal-dependent hydrolase n=1 Tax=Halobaculum sp. CBA1158 TaxID=2904243 RepID=UPI001F16C82D|nr:metal-dependent hydrolase [Halobaculum sp. CBA1158]UIO99390.1 metal-dependent hydrolase [Halobaculum sp. CBA1158]